DLGDDGLFTHRGAPESPDEEDPDAVDTAPTRVVGSAEDDRGAEPSGGRHAASGGEQRRSWDPPEDDDYLPGPGWLFAPVYGAAPPSAPEYSADVRFGGRAGDAPDQHHPAEQPARDEPVDAAPPAIHLPLDDPHRAPDGYPIKGSMRTSRYHVPGT